MQASKDNILLRLDKDGEWRYVVVNPLAGNVDFLNEDFFGLLEKVSAGEPADPQSEQARQLLERGYLQASAEAESAATQEILERAWDGLEKNNSNAYAIVPAFRCGLGCSYCSYQDRLATPPMSLETLDKVMEVISSHQQASPSEYPPHLVLYGGECLGDDDESYQLVEHLLTRYMDRFGLVSMYTTGFNLKRYGDLLTRQSGDKLSLVFHVLENDDTADPDHLLPPDVEACVNHVRRYGLRVRLKLKVQPQTVEQTARMVNYLLETGIAVSSNCLFRFAPVPSQLCSVFNPCAVDYSLYREIFQFYRDNPQLEFASFAGRGAVDRIQMILRTRERFSPREVFCEANLNLLVFDPAGNLYPCYEQAGDESAAIGNVYDETPIDFEALGAWRGRSVCSIPECGGCSARFLCSGGCGKAALEATGKLLSPSCQPYGDLLKWAFDALYLDFLDSERYAPVET